MNTWRIFSLLGLGGLTQSIWGADQHAELMWAIVSGVSLLGWFWTAVFGAAGNAGRRIAHMISGRPMPLPATDPKALAAEIEALNAQIAQLRDTATSFDVSFDQTLARMDERLRRVEQQSSYINVGR
jgi:hypothetical protein